MTATRKVTVAIIGGGPGGYVAGIRCGQLGVDAVVIDDAPLGGTCLNVGCIPSKALIHAADEFATIADTSGRSALGISAGEPSIDLATTVGWKNGIVARLNAGVASLLRRAGTDVIKGRATIVDGKTVEVATSTGEAMRLEVEHLVLATGSSTIALPAFPFGGQIISSTEALDLTAPPRAMVVVGGGYVGVELGTAYAKLGTHVTIVEAENRLLPLFDAELTDPIAQRLRALDVSILTSTSAVEPTPDGLTIEDTSGRRHLQADKILVTVGRRPATTGFGLERLGLAMSGGAVAIDDRCHTSMRNVWAVGDVTGEPALAHRAMKQGAVVAGLIAGGPAAFDARAIPAIVFSDPEIVVVGADQAEAERLHGEVVVGRFPFTANGRMMTLDRSVGFVRVVARADDHLVVGIQAVGTAVAELSGSFGLAIEMGARLEDIAGTIHAHPTLGEAFAEAAMLAMGHGLHS